LALPALLPPDRLALRRVAATWWPLAVSWLLMAAEPPILAAVVARLANPDIHLAAYGSVTFPLIGIIQAPILTLLSLSTAMSKDMDSFLKGRRLMFILGGGLTALYALIAFTPLYDVIVERLIGAPPEIVEPARLGMAVGLPWAFAVAYRRFHQGLMIRMEHARAVTVGTLFRFLADAIVIFLAFRIESLPGTVVATGMMVCGVITEAVYVGLRVRPVLRHELKDAPSPQDRILLRDMVTFFIPLGLTPLLNQLIRPIGSAALSRMPEPLVTLAIWPVIAGFSFLIVTPGAAFNEVVIAMLDRPGARRSLQVFMAFLMAVQFALMLVLSLTPLSYLWFWKVSGLPQDLALLGSQAFLLLIPGSLISPLNSWFSGVILHSRRSRVVTEGMAVYLAVYVLALWLGGRAAPVSGIFLAVSSSMLASLFQTAWLAFRSRPAIRGLG
jgi:hypothetical protein